MKKFMLILFSFILVGCSASSTNDNSSNKGVNNEDSTINPTETPDTSQVTIEFNEEDSKKYANEFFSDDIVMFDYLCPPHETFELTNNETGWGLHISLDKQDSIFRIIIDSSPILVYYGKFDFIDSNTIQFYGDLASNYDFELKPTDSDLDFTPEVPRSDPDGIALIDSDGLYFNYGITKIDQGTKNDKNFCKINQKLTQEDLDIYK